MGSSFRLLGVLRPVVGWSGGRGLVLVLRVLVHHRLGVARTRCTSVRLMGELVLLVGRAVLGLMRLGVWTSHGRHCVKSARVRQQKSWYLLDPGGIWYI